MFAAATREVVFSNPKVVRRVNAEFIPVALKAGTVDNPPPGVEGDFYRAIRQTRAVPQGICSLNSAGSVLAWALSFDREERIPNFLDHVKTRYQAASNRSIYAERFQQYPTRKLPDVPAPQLPVVPPRHNPNEMCIGAVKKSAGGLVGTIIGRRIGDNGKYLQETRRQENYMEARVELGREFQRQLLDTARKANSDRFELPDSICRAIVAPAYLGQLDVNPLGVRPGANENRVRQWRFTGQRVEAKSSSSDFTIRLEGTSHVEGGDVAQPNGSTWDHVVKLSWEGFAEISEQGLTRVCLVAKGSEQLRWGNQNLLRTKEPEAGHLMAGHAINVDSKVEYGLLVKPVRPTKPR